MDTCCIPVTWLVLWARNALASQQPPGCSPYPLQWPLKKVICCQIAFRLMIEPRPV